jgi:hypothetical protein
MSVCGREIIEVKQQYKLMCRVYRWCSRPTRRDIATTLWPCCWVPSPTLPRLSWWKHTSDTHTHTHTHKTHTWPSLTNKSAGKRLTGPSFVEHTMPHTFTNILIFQTFIVVQLHIAWQRSALICWRTRVSYEPDTCRKNLHSWISSDPFYRRLCRLR